MRSVIGGRTRECIMGRVERTGHAVTIASGGVGPGTPRLEQGASLAMGIGSYCGAG